MCAIINALFSQTFLLASLEVAGRIVCLLFSNKYVHLRLTQKPKFNFSSIGEWKYFQNKVNIMTLEQMVLQSKLKSPSNCVVILGTIACWKLLTLQCSMACKFKFINPEMRGWICLQSNEFSLKMTFWDKTNDSNGKWHHANL